MTTCWKLISSEVQQRLAPARWAFPWSSPCPVIPDGLVSVTQGPVSWLAGRDALPPSQVSPVALGRTLTAYSRGGGCGFGFPDYRINPSTFPFDPRCFAPCGEPLQHCCAPLVGVRQGGNVRRADALALRSRRPTRRPIG